jgi:hypothetical protein
VFGSGGNMSIAVSEARKAWSLTETKVEDSSSRMGLMVKLRFSEDAIIRGIGACREKTNEFGERNTRRIKKFWFEVGL